MLASRFYAKWSDELIHLAQHYEFKGERLNSVMRVLYRCKFCGQNLILFIHMFVDLDSKIKKCYANFADKISFYVRLCLSILILRNCFNRYTKEV